mgnify:CR=1 FL=1|jgi:hypothetical protein
MTQLKIALDWNYHYILKPNESGSYCLYGYNEETSRYEPVNSVQLARTFADFLKASSFGDNPLRVRVLYPGSHEAIVAPNPLIFSDENNSQ